MVLKYRKKILLANALMGISNKNIVCIRNMKY